ncbi:hypothetical protein Tco_0916202 [Tanacetum coccineum]
MIASSSSRNSSKNMPRFSSNDMVHNHHLDVAKKKIQERDRNSTTSVTTSARIQTTADDSKPKPRSNNQTSRSLPTLGGRGGESFWEGGDDFGVDGLRFHTCLTDILGFLEKLEWWFEQDIDKEEVRFEGDEDGDEV